MRPESGIVSPAIARYNAAADAEWKQVARESEKDGRILRERPESIYMKATDYSAMQ